jgi:hypothetical protein
MNVITLTNPKTVTVQEAKTKTITTLTVERVVDLPTQQIVRCFVKELDEPVVLWSSTTTPTYAAIGQWTDTDVANRLTSLYNS